MQKTSEMCKAMENRERFYRFLSRIFEKEINPFLIRQMENADVPDCGGQEEMEEGFRLLKGYVQNKTADVLKEELAIDYAKIFLGAGQADGKAAFPYESVYTSKEGLIMQDAWSSVRDIYASKGLAIAAEQPDIKEDHIAVEMLYMAQLCSDSFSEQALFLKEHLLNWVPAFCGDVIKYAETDFYKGAAHLLVGYLKSDLEFLEHEVSDNEEITASSYFVSPEEMDNLLDGWKEKYRIYAPKLLKKRGSNGEDIVRYKEISSVKEIVFDRQSNFSAKEVYYPIMQTMFYFTDTACREKEIDMDKDILLFLHPCDINAMARLDNIFLKNGGQADIYYKRFRDKVKIVMMECKESYENCFCASMGSNVAEDYSLAVGIGEDGIRVQVKERAFLDSFSSTEKCDFKPQFVTSNAKKAVLPVIEGQEMLKTASTLKYWDTFDEKCIGCGGCNTVCPTCSCFDTIDVTYHEDSRDGERRRVWSSCMLDSFTMTAGGNRARKTSGANMRFKTLHKVYDYRKRFGGDANMCVGCGRCIAQCPKDINFLDTINGFHDALEEVKNITGGQTE